jgi:hypothetical protein
LAAIFANSGVYTSSAIFIDHFKHAVWVGAAFSAIGIIAAVALPRRAKLGTAVELPIHGAEIAAEPVA